MESQKYIAEYLGCAEVSNFFNKSAVPWVVKEVLRQSHHEKVTVQLSDGYLLVENPLVYRTVWRHSVNHIHHFSQTVADPCCFLYFVRERSLHPPSSASNTLFLYRMRDKDMVSVLFSTIREHSKRSTPHQARSFSDASAINLQQLRRFVESSSCDHQLHQLNQLSGCSSDTILSSKAAAISPVRFSWNDVHRHSHFEVQYVCKIKTSHRKGPVSFIDAAVRQFLFSHQQPNTTKTGGVPSALGNDSQSSSATASILPAHPVSVASLLSSAPLVPVSVAPPISPTPVVSLSASTSAPLVPVSAPPKYSASDIVTASSSSSGVFNRHFVRSPGVFDAKKSADTALNRNGSGDWSAWSDVRDTSWASNDDEVVSSAPDEETEVAEEATEDGFIDEKATRSVPIPIGRPVSSSVHSSEHNLGGALARGNQLSPLPESVSETAAEIMTLMESAQEDRRVGGQDNVRLGGQEDARTREDEDIRLGGQNDMLLGGNEDMRLGGQEDVRLGGQEEGCSTANTLSEDQAAQTTLKTENSTSLLKSTAGAGDSAASLPTPPASHLMNILYIADSELCLISTVDKTLRLKTQLADITQVAQGVKCKEYFGYICRDPSSFRYVSSDSLNSNGSDQSIAPSGGIRSNYKYYGYIFRCQNNRISEEVAQLLKQVIHNAHEICRRERHKRHSDSTACQHCPAEWFNKLCVHIEGLSNESLLSAIWRAVETLPPADCHQLKVKMSGADLEHADSEAELLMSLIRLMCDEKQTRHRHVTAAASHSVDRSDDLLFDLSSSLSRAKKTLTSRFEQVWRQSWSRDDSGESAASSRTSRRRTMKRSCSLTSDADAPNDSDRFDNGMVASDVTAASEDEPRRRSSTFSGICTVDSSKSRTESQTVRSNTASTANLSQATSQHGPLMTIFKRMGPSTPSKSSVPDSKTPISSQRSSLDPYSWRQSILWRVKSPGNAQSPVPSAYGGQVTHVVSPRSADDAKQMWRRLITQQILLNRMERENAKVLERCHSAGDGLGSNRSITGGGGRSGGERIQYHQLPDCPQAAADCWERVLGQLEEKTEDADYTWEQLSCLVLEGVPLSRRAEIWQLLVARHCERHSFSGPSRERAPNYHAPYQQLISELTSFQREILTDLGRTFPHHPYFRSPFGAGQLEMFNVLKAISLLDTELGYCQGLGFIAGILLFHMTEKEAYNVMKHVLFGLDLRKQFMPDMVAMHIQMYQLSRLLHDLQRELYEHLEKHEVSPMLYAAPWFMTMFASQFPIGFSSRVFDLVLICGVEALFRVSIALLLEHSQQLLSLSGLEEIMEHVKGDMCHPSMQTARAVFARASQQDISQQLLTYEVEYHVLQEEVICSPSADNEVNRLSAVNQNLKRQMMDLLQQLQTARDNEQMMSAQNKRLEERLRAEEHRSEQLITICQSFLQSPHTDHELLKDQLQPLLHSASESRSSSKKDRAVRSCSAHNLTSGCAANSEESLAPVSNSNPGVLRCASSGYLAKYAGSGGVARQRSSSVLDGTRVSSLASTKTALQTHLPTIKLDKS